MLQDSDTDVKSIVSIFYPVFTKPKFQSNRRVQVLCRAQSIHSARMVVSLLLLVLLVVVVVRKQPKPNIRPAGLTKESGVFLKMQTGMKD